MTRQRDDARDYYVKLGHRWGNKAISVGYGQTHDLLTNGSSVQRIGFGYTYVIPKPKVELYASYGNVNLKSWPVDFRTGRLTGNGSSNGVVARNGTADFERINTVAIGSRVKFDRLRGLRNENSQAKSHRELLARAAVPAPQGLRRIRLL